jgi:ribosome-binding factor A
VSYRIQRVNALIQRELSQLLQRHLSDPRIKLFLHVTAVDTAPDLSLAKIYISSAEGEPEDRKTTMAALTSATGHLRTELAKVVNLRHMPELTFHWDDSIERGDRILRLLDQVAHERDEEPSTGD